MISLGGLSLCRDSLDIIKLLITQLKCVDNLFIGLDNLNIRLHNLIVGLDSLHASLNNWNTSSYFKCKL